MYSLKSEIKPTPSTHDHIPPHPPVSDDEQTHDQKITSVSGSCENIATEPYSSKIGSLDENETSCSKSSRKKDELATSLLSDAEKFPSNVSSSSKISVDSNSKANTHLPSESIYTSSVSSLSHSSSSIRHNSSQIEESSSTSAAMENSSTSESPCKVIPSSETSESPPKAIPSSETWESSPKVVPPSEISESSPKAIPSSEISESSPKTISSSETLESSPKVISSSDTSEWPLEGIPSSESSCETLPCAKSTENVFFQKLKIFQPDIQAGETLELDTNLPTPTPAERHQWVLMNRRFIQKEGYRLGIKPGTFYNSNKGYFVEMPNGTNYEIIITNENPVPCNVEVFIDKRPKPTICFRLRPDKPMSFEGPIFHEQKFTFLRSKDAPLQSGISSANTSNGIIEAVFTPQKTENVRSRAVSDPVPFSRNLTSGLHILGIKTETPKLRSYTTSSVNAERGIDIAKFCQGATALSGEQAPKAFKRAEPMETDDSRRCVIRLRLIARTDEPSICNEEDISSMCPPPVEELQDSESDI